MIALDAQLACLWEACAEKAGNVTRRRDFADTTLIDFLASAAAAAPEVAQAGTKGVGRAILDAVRATRRVCRVNTNLGMILLLAPLCAARHRGPLRSEIGHVVDALTVDDSRAVCEAIRLASPSGLGKVAEGDVAEEPTLPLTQLMALAADRDRVAKQYATKFAEVLGEVADDIEAGLDAGLDEAIRRAQVRQLSRHGDSLIARKRGEVESAEAARLASVGDVAALNAWLRAEGNARNPGTTADLLAAGLFVLLSEDRLPRDACWAFPLHS